MFTVALIGPDGAGKTTIARRLEQTLAVPAKYLYMGVNWDAGDHMLPTTRLVRLIRSRRRDGRAGGPPVRQASGRARGVGTVRGGLALANRLAEEWYRQLLAWSYVRRGVVVIFDRHFYPDYHAHDVAASERSLGRRLHGALLAHVYPKPDLVVFLDAPAEVLYARKGEGTLDYLEQRRLDYGRLADVLPAFVIVDASRPLDEVTRGVAEAITSFASQARGNGSGDSGRRRGA